MGMSTDCCYFGIANVYLAPWKLYNEKSAGGGLVPVGNVTEGILNSETRTIGNVPNKQTAALGVECSRTIFGTGTFEFVMSCHNTNNLAMVLNGLATTSVAGTQTEFASASKGEYVRLSKIPNGTTPAITVKNLAGTTTYTAGTDYIITGTNSIYILPTGTIPNATTGNNLQIGYTSLATTSINLFSTPLLDYRLFVEARNLLGESTTNVQNTRLLELYKVSLSLSSPFQFIASGDDANLISVTATIKADSYNANEYGVLVGAS